MLHMNKPNTANDNIYHSLCAILRAKTKYALGGAEAWVLAQVLYGEAYTSSGYFNIKWLVNELVTAKWKEIGEEK